MGWHGAATERVAAPFTPEMACSGKSEFALVVQNAFMYPRKCRRKVNGQTKDYWQLAESYRTARGPRHRVVGHLGDLEEPERIGIKEAATGNSDHIRQGNLCGFETLRVKAVTIVPLPGAGRGNPDAVLLAVMPPTPFRRGGRG